MFKRIFAVITPVVCFISLFSVGSVAESGKEVNNNFAFSAASDLENVQESDDSVVSGYTLVAENSDLKLYGDMSTGNFYVKELRGGNIWYSVPDDLDKDNVTKGLTRLQISSQIRVRYMIMDGKNPVGNENVLASSAASEVTVKKVENGIRVDYEFSSISLTIPIIYRLKGDSLEASILANEIKENEEFALTYVELLPAFAAANKSTTGKLLIPDGCGALIPFNSASLYNTYEESVYGNELSVKTDKKTSNKETIRMPVFAALYKDKAVMGIISKGEASAAIAAMVGNDSCGYNSVFTVFRYRYAASDSMLSNNAQTEQTVTRLSEKYSLNEYTVSYSFLSGDNSDYVAVAGKYRDYLIENGLKKLDYQCTFNVDVYGALEIKGNFLGIAYRKYAPLTRYENVVDIVKALKEKGINDLSIRFLGWSKDGTVNYYQQNKVTFSRTLGGKEDFMNMKSNLDEQKVNLITDVDLLRFRKANRKSESKTLFKKTAFEYIFMRSVYAIDLRYEPLRLLSATRIDGNSNSYLKSLAKYDLKNVSLSTLTNLIYSDFNPTNQIDKCEFISVVQKVLKKFAESGVSISGEAVNQYALPFVERIYSVPTKSSAHKLFKSEIPFYQIVLHGYIPMSVGAFQLADDAKDHWLSAVESGLELSYNGIYEDASIVAGTPSEELYSSTYKYWAEDASEYYNAYREYFKKIYNQEIISHQECHPNVMKTVFANGCGAIVNYNEYDVEVDGVKISANSFLEIKE